TVFDPGNNEVGRLEQQYDCCGSDLSIFVGGAFVYKIEGPICVCDGPCCGDQEFFVNTPDGQQIATPGGPARITKMQARNFEDMAAQAFTDADNFGCTFPPDATPQAKAVLLAAVFMIDFLFFEEPVNQDQGGY
ncbi:phospholipid scramblase family protein, partial [bacterium]|nr:phospholipid scramblase family protein [bacterium]